MSMGIPIICNSEIGDTDFIINQSEAGIVLNDLNHFNYEKAIEKIPDLKMLNTKKIRAGAKRFYSLENVIAAYHAVYQKLKIH